MRSWPLTLGVLLFVAFAGALDLAQPPAGDQSLFLIGAKEMGQGAALYRDFWDLKQPGIYDFYFFAGSLGGFTILAVHVFELVYLMLFAGVLVVANARWPAFSPAAPLVPLFAVGLYFISSSDAQQLQVEALAGVPIMLCVWLACEGTRASGAARYGLFAAAGAAAGCALLLKLIFAPLLAVLFLTAVAFGTGTYRPTVRVVAGALAAAVAGAAVPLLWAGATLARQGALDIALRTSFAVPSRIVATLPVQQVSILVAGASWFVHAFAVALFLGTIGAIATFRAAPRDPLARCYAVWIAGALATILAQRTSWWEYQWLLLEVPAGAFAAAGTIALLRSPRTSGRLALLAIAACLALYNERLEVRKIVQLAAHHFALRPADREAYRAAISSNYAGAAHDAASLPAGSDVYVMGNPIFYVVANRTQPLVLNGWSMELLLPDQRDALLAELQKRQPAYVYVTKDDGGPRIAMARAPALGAYFARAYRVVLRGEFGTLYRLVPRA